MAHPTGKVVALGDHPRAKARLTPQESAGVLDGCRKLALDRMGAALAGMLDKVEDELYALADKAADRDERNVFLDARAQARDKRAAIENTFRLHFVDCFDRKVRGEAARASPEVAADELSLMEPHELEEALAVREMSRKLGAACEGELFALSQRMGFLLERPELDGDANPVSPATICEALKDACDQIQADFKVRMALLRQLERHAEAEIRAIYQDLNAHLVERRILPEVRAGMRRSKDAPAPRKEAAGNPPAAPQSDVFAALSRLMSAASASATPAALPGPAPASPFVSELTRLHREAGSAAPDDAALVNVLRELKSAPQAATLGSVDAMTIDIVAMLFDFVFEDRHIPAAVKVLLGRLQIPTLKVALLDPGFFSSKSHPARRLVDLLGQAAIGVDDGQARGGETLAMVQEVVDEILQKFDTDLELFEEMALRVQAFIDRHERAEALLVERSADLIEARERREVALAAAHEEVQRRLEARRWIPIPVREMLAEHWPRALAASHEAQGEGSAAWHRMLCAMDDLLWSVEPKVAAEDRKRLVALLPALLRELHDGMARAQMPDAERDRFLGALVDCHALAVKAGLRGMTTVPEFPAPPAAVPAPAQAAASLVREIVPAEDLRMEEIRLRTPRGTQVRNVFTRTGIWTHLQRGTWVEFARDAGGPVRARLTWISPNKGVYLFTNPMSAAVALSISPEALAEQMRLGEARMLNDAPLVQRAVDSMMASLGGEAAGAASAA